MTFTKWWPAKSRSLRWGGSGKIALATAVLLYIAITIATTYPVAFRLNDVVAGYEGRDAYQYIWSMWWAKKALLELGTSPANLTYLYYPLGASHQMLAVTPLIEWLSLPLQAIATPATAYNLLFLLSFVLTGLTTYLLCYDLTRNHLASFIGGLVLAYCPNRVIHATAGHLPHITTYWFPLYALFLLRLLRRPTWSRSVATGLILAACLLINIMLIAYMVIPITIVLILHQYFSNRCHLLSRSSLLGLGGAFGIAALLTAPFFFPFIASQLQGSLGYLAMEGTVDFSADLLGFLTPSPGHPVFWNLEPLRSFIINNTRYGTPLETLAYVGVVPLALALWGAWHARRKATAWAALALATAILSLGPLLHLAGELARYRVEDLESYFVLPYAALKALPFFEYGRTPARLNETTMLALAPLAAAGLAAMLRKLPREWHRVGLSSLVGAAILFEYLVIFPFPVGIAKAPSFYRELAMDETNFALLDLPLFFRPASSMAMFYQTVHDHPIVGGYIHRIPAEAEPAMRFMERLAEPRMEPDIIFTPPDEQRPLYLARYNIRYITLHLPYLEKARQEAYERFLSQALGPATYRDERIAAFAVPSSPPQDVMSFPLMMLGEGWLELEVGAGERARWMGERAHIYVDAPEGGGYRLEFTAQSFREDRRLEIAVNGATSASVYLKPQVSSHSLDVKLSRGWNEIALSVPDGCEHPIDVEENSLDGRCLSLRFSNISLGPRGTQEPAG